ncbi:GMP synthase [Candidatus Symbiopectobacterium sp. 'North America']|uniref:glutamine amidotransferase n=1 Tax=Candidatus Symbiopectobacterium sp. 'North America' TaxID=2794574 RepID=UPI0018CA8407|nr:glutamine amidotransferase [Candidatus Symbiopectobacterium sp. 'North America']MBG6245481.1 GMP synthase [Candidatus Symbiopectobacterium sp. 'North America']
MDKKPLLIIQMGVPPQSIAQVVGEQSLWFSAALAVEPRELLVVRPERGERLPQPDAVAGAVISGSWSMVTDRLDWSESTAAWLREAYQAQLPLLGVCYGHQLLADVLGGTVADNPKGKEIGLQTVTLTAQGVNDPLLRDHPAHFDAYLTHQQSVLIPPPVAQVLAYSEQDGCQILRYGPHALSVQFHPEFTAAIMTQCVRNSANALRAAGHDVDRLLQLEREPLWACRLLLDFVAQIDDRDASFIPAA